MTKFEEANEVVAELRERAVESLRERHWKNFWRLYLFSSVIIAVVSTILVVGFNFPSALARSVLAFFLVVSIFSQMEPYQKLLKRLVLSRVKFSQERILEEMRNIFEKTSRQAEKEIKDAKKLIETRRRFITYQRVWGEDF